MGTDGKVKSAVLAVVRMENAYLQEWVCYHLNIGFNHVYLCDNNMQNEEEVEKFLIHVLPPETMKSVTVFDHRNDVNVHRQMRFYTQHLLELKSQYDWIACIDVDEFVTFADGSGFHNVHDFLSGNEFKNFGQILLNWRIYGDSGLVVPNLTKRVLDRFTVPAKFDNVNGDVRTNNWHVKPIVRCAAMTSTPTFTCPHFAVNLKPCLANGLPCHLSPFQKPNYGVAYVRHYFTKTIQEFLTRRFRGRADNGNGSKLSIHDLYEYLTSFFETNEITDEKRSIVSNFISEHYTEDEIMAFAAKLER